MSLREFNYVNRWVFQENEVKIGGSQENEVGKMFGMDS